jgi:capsid protein
MMPTNVWRVAQGRGITQASSSIGTINDLEDLCGYELQAAKKNSQTFATITHNATKTDETDIPSAFDSDIDFADMTDEEIEKAIKEEVGSNEQTISFSKAASCGIVYEALPDDYKMELLSTNHPNEKIQDFVKWLCGRSSAVFGLSEQFSTLMPTGSDFRA